jgi:hypothetical protein
MGLMAIETVFERVVAGRDGWNLACEFLWRFLHSPPSCCSS